LIADLGPRGRQVVCNGDIKADGRQPLLTQPLSILVIADPRQHGETEFA
jgi:hypothetical protein